MLPANAASRMRISPETSCTLQPSLAPAAVPGPPPDTSSAPVAHAESKELASPACPAPLRGPSGWALSLPSSSGLSRLLPPTCR